MYIIYIYIYIYYVFNMSVVSLHQDYACAPHGAPQCVPRVQHR